MSNVTVIRGKGPRPAEEHRSRIKEQIQNMTHHQPNVGMGERHLSLAIGGALAWLAAGTRRPGLIALLGGLGIALLHRGATGHCELYHAMGMDTTSEADMTHARSRRPGQSQTQGNGNTGDMVNQASEESFPASDPPSYTPTTSIGDVKEQKVETVKPV